jgi:peptide/nickel transport system substrate-binding protein
MKRFSKSSLATLVMASSLGTAGAFAAPVASAATATSANTMTLGQYQPYTDEFIPFIASDQYTNNIWSYAFDTLLSVNGNFQYIPELAKSWKWSADHKTITMNLDPKAKWSDSAPVTSQDVLLAMNYLASKVYNTTQQGQYGYVVQNVVGYNEISSGKATSFDKTGGFTIVNSKTFQIHLTAVDAAILNADLSTIAPVPSHVLGKIPFDQWPTSSFDKKPSVVDGPYSFTNVQSTNSVEMTANRYYIHGQPKIQNVVWQTVSTDVAPGLLASGKLDFMVEGFKFGDVSKLKQVPGINVDTLPALQFYYMGLRMNNYPEFQNVLVRQAFEYAIDRKSMLDGILKGYGEVLNSPLPSVSWAAAPSSKLNQYAYNPTKANQLLDKAGWKVGKDGWRIDPKTGKTAQLHIVSPIDPAVRQPMAQAIAQEYTKIHIHVIVDKPLDIQTFYKDLEDPKYKPIQMYVGAWSLSDDPDPRGIWDTTDAFNMEHWADKKNDAMIATTWGPQAFDVNNRKKSLIAWQAYVNQQMPLNLLLAFDNVYAYSSKLHIPTQDITPAGLLHVEDWTLSN